MYVCIHTCSSKKLRLKSAIKTVPRRRQQLVALCDREDGRSERDGDGDSQRAREQESIMLNAAHVAATRFLYFHITQLVALYLLITTQLHALSLCDFLSHFVYFSVLASPRLLFTFNVKRFITSCASVFDLFLIFSLICGSIFRRSSFAPRLLLFTSSLSLALSVYFINI